jgi:hypothetical protein
VPLRRRKEFYNVGRKLTGNEKKLIFVSVWFSFTVALFLLNR